MKTRNKHINRLLPVIKTGAAIGIAIIAATTARAQVTAPNSPPPAATDTSGKISHRAKEFLKEAAQANQVEISLADIALEKSQNKDVRDLAQMLRTDHQMNFAQLQPLARSRGVELDSAISWMNQRSINHLQKTGDVDFDREYTIAMIKDHVSAIKTFDKAVAEVEEPDVKQYAQSTLPGLRGHLLKAEKAARSVGVEQDKISTILKELPNQEVERSVTVNP